MTFAQLTEAASADNSPLSLPVLTEMAKRRDRAAHSIAWAEIPSWIGVLALIVVLIAITVSVVAGG